MPYLFSMVKQVLIEIKGFMDFEMKSENDLWYILPLLFLLTTNSGQKTGKIGI